MASKRHSIHRAAPGLVDSNYRAGYRAAVDDAVALLRQYAAEAVEPDARRPCLTHAAERIQAALKQRRHAPVRATKGQQGDLLSGAAWPRHRPISTGRTPT